MDNINQDNDAEFITENDAQIIRGSDFSRYWYTDIREIVTIKDMLAGSAELYRNNI